MKVTYVIYKSIYNFVSILNKIGYEKRLSFFNQKKQNRVIDKMINIQKIYKTFYLTEAGRPKWQISSQFHLTLEEIELILSWGKEPCDAIKKFKELKKTLPQLSLSEKEKLSEEKRKKRKEKAKFYVDKRRKEYPHYYLEQRLYSFTKKTNSPKITAQMAIEKFGPNPVCYLTGEPIDLANPKTYWLDHRVPLTKGGLGTLDNLELAIPHANLIKSNLILEDFVRLCRKIADRFPNVI